MEQTLRNKDGISQHNNATKNAATSSLGSNSLNFAQDRKPAGLIEEHSSNLKEKADAFASNEKNTRVESIFVPLDNYSHRQSNNVEDVEEKPAALMPNKNDCALDNAFMSNEEALNKQLSKVQLSSDPISFTKSQTVDNTCLDKSALTLRKENSNILTSSNNQNNYDREETNHHLNDIIPKDSFENNMQQSSVCSAIRSSSTTESHGISIVKDPPALADQAFPTITAPYTALQPPNYYNTSACFISFNNKPADDDKTDSHCYQLTSTEHPEVSPYAFSFKYRQLPIIKAQSLDFFNENESIEDDCRTPNLYDSPYFEVPQINLRHPLDKSSRQQHSEASTSIIPATLVEEGNNSNSSTQTSDKILIDDRLNKKSSSLGDNDRSGTQAQVEAQKLIGIPQCLKPNLRTASFSHPAKPQSFEARPIYPNVPYSPYASPYGSPRSNRRRTPLRESRRISIEQSGSFLQLNQYKLMDQIGQGSYGLVKLAYSEEDSTHYAMKILSKRRLLRKAGLIGRGPKKATSPLDRVYREIAVLKKLDHPNVVKLVEVLDDPLEDSLYLVFELVQQGEVLNIPTDKPLSEERTWSVFRDAVQGLEYLHYQRIIHADIKPGNLLLTECGHVKIADLGVCNEFLGEDATMNNGSTGGTPAFRAPETLIPGQHLYSGKAVDVWALGATLYSLVFGNVPFIATSIPILYEKIKNEDLTFPESPKISADLRECIKCMLTKDPAQRITLPQLKEHGWVTTAGTNPLPTEDENCRLVQINEDDINSVVKSIPKLDTLILIKTMLKNHSFGNPFMKGVSGKAPQRGGSRIERFTRAGRSNSAPGAYHLAIDRQLSGDSILPSLSENGSSPCNETADET